MSHSRDAISCIHYLYYNSKAIMRIISGVYLGPWGAAVQAIVHVCSDKSCSVAFHIFPASLRSIIITPVEHRHSPAISSAIEKAKH
jgi:hypothetical protein